MLKLYNTLTRKKEEFKPMNPPDVGLYTCGPTVYDYAHIGNLRTYIFEDVLRRVLEENGFEVKHVMNITDVGHLTSDADTGEDKMERGAKREGKTVWEIAEHYTQAFKKDMERLNLVEPHIWCKATDHIQEQIDLVKRLEEKQVTYKTSDGIYLDTSKVKDYGKLARLDISGLQAGARIEMKEKKHPTDFALWKFSQAADRRRSSRVPESQIDADNKKTSKRLMEWNSPWGTGFPGWHIECSAMSMKYLGETFDIHCGGIDHIPVHHTNEIAQTETATGKPFAHWWLHGEFLQVREGRMGKSEGNLLTLQTLIDKGYDPLSYRYFTFTAHYRQKLNFSWDALDAAQTAYNKLKELIASFGDDAPPPLSSPLLRGGASANALKVASTTSSSLKRGENKRGACTEHEQNFMNAVNDDLNMPQALAVVWDLIKSDISDAEKRATLLACDQILGLNLAQAQSAVLAHNTLPREIQALLHERDQTRNKKDFATSDKIRNKLASLGYLIEDSAQGQIVRKK